jgi:hypothetical protein
MSSPFPGMDLYLEDPAYWSDFHASFLLYLRDSINERLPENYEVRIDEKVNLVETSPDRIKLLEPDLALSQSRPSLPGVTASTGAVTLEPVTIPHLFIEEEQHERWIEILHRPERSLVTVLELLSPANKEEPGLHRYRDKRFAVLQQAVHLVEVDLLLSGRRLQLRHPLPPADYYVLVSRADQRPDCQVYHWTLRQPLPAIPLPLKAPDPDLEINLGEVFTTTYDKGRYARSLNYSAPPAVHMLAPTLDWVLQQANPKAAGPTNTSGG